LKHDPDLPPNAVSMMERRLIREVESADDPFNRQLALLLLEYFYSGEYEFWMQDGEILFASPDPDDDLNNDPDTDYNKE